MKNIKNLIRGKGFTFREFSKKLGLSEPGLNRKLNGKNSFTAVEIISAAKVLNIDSSEFLDAIEKDLKSKE